MVIVDANTENNYYLNEHLIHFKSMKMKIIINVFYYPRLKRFCKIYMKRINETIIIGCVSTSVWMHHLKTIEVHGE